MKYIDSHNDIWELLIYDSENLYAVKSTNIFRGKASALREKSTRHALRYASRYENTKFNTQLRDSVFLCDPVL